VSDSANPRTPDSTGPAADTPAPRRRRWPFVLVACASALVMLTSLTGAGIAVLYTRLEDNISTVDFSAIGDDGTRQARPIVDDEGNYTALNILLMGSDSRQGAGNDAGYGNPDIMTGERSDTTIVLHVSADRRFATAVSIPRDTWITLPTCRRNEEVVGGYESKFNAAFEMAGPACTVKAVEDLTGLHIDHFAVIDFAGFKNVVDALGGVEVCLTSPVDDPQSNLQLPAGTSTVFGEDALAFVRARKTLSDGSDLARIKRQQQFLSSMIRSATSTQLILNPVSLYGVLDAATASLTTDPHLGSLDQLRDLAWSLRSLQPEDITFLTMPWLERGDGENVVVDPERAALVWESMRADQPWLVEKPDKVPALPVAPYEVSVRVLNGSGIPGKASAAATLLQAQGFVIAGVDDADRPDYATSVVQYDTDSAAVGKALAWAISGTATPDGATAAEVPGVGTVTIIIGQDQTEVRTVKVRADTEDPITAPTTADKVICS
jgi:LCP family protein required for cell wall assembly